MATEEKSIIARSGTRSQLSTAGQLKPGQAGFCTDEKTIVYRRRLSEADRPGEFDFFTSCENGLSNSPLISGSIEIVPNVFIIFGTIGSVVFSLATPKRLDVVNEYKFRFTAGDSTNVTWPSGISWIDGSTPVITSGKKYELNILDGCAVCGEF